MDCYGLIDLNENKAILFVPKLDNMYRIWMNFESKEAIEAKYGVEVRFMDELEATIASYNGTLYVNQGVNSDSGLTTQIPEDKYLQGHSVNS